MPVYRIYEPGEMPARVKRGRRPSNNNDTELVAQGLEGYLDGAYKSYNHAARELAPLAREQSYRKMNGVFTIECVDPATDGPSVIRRLAKKISMAHKDWLRT